MINNDQIFDTIKNALLEELRDESYVDYLLENDAIMVFYGYTMEEVAWEMVEEMFSSEYHQFLGYYLDIDSLIRDMKIDGNYVEFESGVIEILD